MIVPCFLSKKKKKRTSVDSLVWGDLRVAGLFRFWSSWTDLQQFNNITNPISESNRLTHWFPVGPVRDLKLCPTLWKGTFFIHVWLTLFLDHESWNIIILNIKQPHKSNWISNLNKKNLNRCVHVSCYQYVVQDSFFI